MHTAYRRHVSGSLASFTSLLVVDGVDETTSDVDMIQ